jgi:hypothetical protein
MNSQASSFKMRERMIRPTKVWPKSVPTPLTENIDNLINLPPLISDDYICKRT